MTGEAFYEKFEKKDIPALPRYAFGGRIVVVQSLAEAERAADILMKCERIGIDTETRPSFKKGIVHKVALLQASTSEICFLFRLNMIGLPQCLIDVLEDERVMKVGLSLKDDLQSLRKRHKALHAGNWVDLQAVVAQKGIEDMSLQKLFAGFFRMHISKGARLTNWENDVLTEAQKAYAATDAEACLRIYEKLTSNQQ